MEKKHLRKSKMNINPLHVAEVLITLVVTVIFDPKKLHISAKCVIIAGLSFLVAYGAFEAEVAKMQMAILLAVYALACYLVALYIGVRYNRSRTDRMWILLAVVLGIGLFVVYTKYYYRPIASVTDYYKEMHTKQRPDAELAQNADQEAYLNRIKEEFLDADRPARGRGSSNRRAPSEKDEI
jgi:glucan phosphoethanolaminetransferase (alkaline phosphatase superfamily)